MRKRADWMVPSDDPILEFVEHVGEVTPAVIARNLDLHRKHVNKRARELANRGLVASTGKGFYKITDAGRDYLSGELDAGGLEDVEDNDDEK